MAADAHLFTEELCEILQSYRSHKKLRIRTDFLLFANK